MQAQKSVGQLLSEGFVAQEAGDLALARQSFEAVLSKDRGNLQALQLLGIVLAMDNQLGAAIETFGKAVDVDGQSPLVRFNRAKALSEVGRFQEALDDLTVALEREPRNAQGLLTKGNCLKSLGRLLPALECFDQAIEASPDFAQAFNNRGVVLKDLSRYREALQSYAQAIVLNPRYVDAFVNLGVAFGLLGHAEQALAGYETALAIDATNAIAHNNRGNILNDLGRHEEALACFETAISFEPNYADAFNNKGNALKALGKLDLALQSYEAALAINHAHSKAMNNRGVVQLQSGQVSLALDSFDRALEIEPSYVDAISNRGGAFYELGRHEDAGACLDQALDKDPSYSPAQLNKALLCLLTGDYSRGWALYESRLTVDRRAHGKEMAGRRWHGQEDIAGKTVLLYAEQGLGDTIQFCRYARLVKTLGAKVVLEVPRPLMRLLANLEGVDSLVELGSELPQHDLQCPLLSLPMIFDTTLESIPSPGAYLQAIPDMAAEWAIKLSGDSGLKVGLVWNGGFRKDEPELWALNNRRNIALDIFAQGLSDSAVSFYSLQKGDPAESEVRGQELRYWPRGNFFNFADDLLDFSDTAALIANLDLVISVDTSTAHLSAALGKPTWILNRYDTCWRWLLDRSDSPWYDAVTLYRQDTSGDWQGVLQRVATDLAKLIRT